MLVAAEPPARKRGHRPVGRVRKSIPTHLVNITTDQGRVASPKASRYTGVRSCAGVTQLVECLPSKQNVAGSSPVSRSTRNSEYEARRPLSRWSLLFPGQLAFPLADTCEPSSRGSGYSRLSLPVSFEPARVNTPLMGQAGFFYGTLESLAAARLHFRSPVDGVLLVRVVVSGARTLRRQVRRFRPNRRVVRDAR